MDRGSIANIIVKSKDTFMLKYRQGWSLYMLSLAFLLFTISCVQPGSLGATTINADSTPQRVFTVSSTLNDEFEKDSITSSVDGLAGTQPALEQDAIVGIEAGSGL